MSTSYTIGWLAKGANVPPSTVRYYERVGLLTPHCRSRGNYRIYDTADLDRLRFIKAAQGTGFTLDDIRVLMGLESGTTHVCDEVQDLLTHRLADVEQRMKDLKRVQGVLRASLKLCRSDTADNRCKVIEHLTGQKPHEK
jgi:MerR family mercuric resistance operon transcriptional regulator